MQLRHKPAVLVLTTGAADIRPDQIRAGRGVARGAYVLADAPGGTPEVLLLATGSEVQLCVAAHEQLVGRRAFAAAW